MHAVGIKKARILAVNGSRTLACKTWGGGMGREEGGVKGWEGRSRHIHLLFERWKFVPSVRVHAHLKNSTHKRAKHFIKINNRSTLIWQFNELTVLSPKLRSC